jgi:tRNA-2-methylthio-N6-dimethylallyladenosine synthase
VDHEVVQERFERLVALQERISLEKATAQVGATVEVLVEGRGRKGGSTQGRTRTNRIVHLLEALEPGTFAWAEIASAAPHHLTGRVVPGPHRAAV